MGNYAVIENNVIVNVIEADTHFAASINAVALPEGYGIGDSIEAGGFVKAAPLPLEDTLFPPLTARQLWLAAYRTMALKEDDVIAMTATMEDQEAAEELRIEIRKAQTYERDHPAMDDLAALVGLPVEQFDALWRWAATL